jgi:hypothetical protein
MKSQGPYDVRFEWGPAGAAGEAALRRQVRVW